EVIAGNSAADGKRSLKRSMHAVSGVACGIFETEQARTGTGPSRFLRIAGSSPSGAEFGSLLVVTPIGVPIQQRLHVLGYRLKSRAQDTVYSQSQAKSSPTSVSHIHRELIVAILFYDE